MHICFCWGRREQRKTHQAELTCRELESNCLTVARHTKHGKQIPIRNWLSDQNLIVNRRKTAETWGLNAGPEKWEDIGDRQLTYAAERTRGHRANNDNCASIWPSDWKSQQGNHNDSLFPGEHGASLGLVPASLDESVGKVQHRHYKQQAVLAGSSNFTLLDSGYVLI